MVSGRATLASCVIPSFLRRDNFVSHEIGTAASLMSTGPSKLSAPAERAGASGSGLGTSPSDRRAAAAAGSEVVALARYVRHIHTPRGMSDDATLGVRLCMHHLQLMDAMGIRVGADRRSWPRRGDRGAQGRREERLPPAALVSAAREADDVDNDGRLLAMLHPLRKSRYPPRARWRPGARGVSL